MYVSILLITSVAASGGSCPRRSLPGASMYEHVYIPAPAHCSAAATRGVPANDCTYCAGPEHIKSTLFMQTHLFSIAINIVIAAI